MAKTTRKPTSRGGRRKPPPKTIDLKAAPIEEAAKTGVNEVAEAAESKTAKSATGKFADKIDKGVKAAAFSFKRDTGKQAPSKQTAAAQATGGDDSQATNAEPGSAAGSSLPKMVLSGVAGGAVVLAGSLLMSGSMTSDPSANGQPAGSEALQATNAEVAALKAEIAELTKAQAAARQAGEAGVPAELSERIARLEDASSGSADLTARLEAAEQSAAEAKKTADESVEQLSQLGTRIGEGSEGGPSAVTGMGAKLEEAVSGIADLDKKTTDMGAQLDETAQSLAGLTSRVGEVEEVVNNQVLPSMDQISGAAEAAVQGQAVARSVSARALAAVLETGGGFSGELAAAEALVGETEAIAGLKGIAADGIKSNDALVSEFDDLAPRMIATETMPADGDNIMSRFVTSAKSLVRVRPAGPIEGDTVAAVVSRMGAALKAGELEAVESEWDGLPDAAKEASSTFIEDLRTRRQAGKLIGSVIEELSAPVSAKQG